MGRIEDLVQSKLETTRILFGFDLTWQEVFALRHYLKCFQQACQEEKITEKLWDNAAYQLFLLDYFDLPLKQMLSNEECAEGVRNYCRRHVNEWREERTFP